MGRNASTGLDLRGRFPQGTTGHSDESSGRCSIGCRCVIIRFGIAIASHNNDISWIRHYPGCSRGKRHCVWRVIRLVRVGGIDDFVVAIRQTHVMVCLNLHLVLLPIEREGTVLLSVVRPAGDSYVRGDVLATIGLHASSVMQMRWSV